MFGVVWHEPIAGPIEEWETFHLRKAPEIHVHALLLHVHHAHIAFLQLFHCPFLGIGVEDVLQLLFFCFSAQDDVLAAHHCGENVAMYFLHGLFGVDAIHYLVL